MKIGTFDRCKDTGCGIRDAGYLIGLGYFLPPNSEWGLVFGFKYAA